MECQGTDLGEDRRGPFAGLDEHRGRDAEIQDGDESQGEEPQEHGGHFLDLFRGDDLPDVGGGDEVCEQSRSDPEQDGEQQHRIDDGLEFMVVILLLHAFQHVAGPHGQGDEEAGGKIRVRVHDAVGGDGRIVGKRCQNDIVQQVHEVDEQGGHEGGERHHGDSPQHVSHFESAFQTVGPGRSGSAHHNTSFPDRI